jgi:nitrous oxidase accessory protein NosD
VRVGCELAIVLVLAVSTCIGAGQNETGTPIVVPEGGSIQDAVDRAPSGAVVVLADGSFNENVVIGKSLTVRGPEIGEAEWTGAAPGPVVRVSGESISVRIEEVTIRDARGHGGHGIAIEGTVLVVLQDVTLRGNAWFGLSAADHSQAVLIDCTVAENDSAGLMSQDYARIELERCIVRDNTSHGVLALHLAEVTVTASQLSGNWAGVWAWDATRVRLVDTVVEHNLDYGAIASTAALLVLDRSTISDNGFHGLLFEESARGVLEESQVIGNGADGLFAEGDAILEIDRCTFARNGRAGIRIAWGECTGGFDPKRYFAGRIEGTDNVVPGPEEQDGNVEAAVCPWPAGVWPPGFLVGS